MWFLCLFDQYVSISFHQQIISVIQSQANLISKLVVHAANLERDGCFE